VKPILEIQNVSKKFQILHNRLPYLSIREKIANIFSPSAKHEQFWALRNIVFSVQPGESLGIIGKNGAGKSTLLKILSKITPPSEGRIISRGRIASLLEVGTGFHQELTGRENIFMNGSILGMKRIEIVRKFDEIVDFSGVENFLDTPLKHYSSGMQLRLAFAVAAHLEPEILIIDEVLAVGDAEFQKKCLGKMQAVSKSGRTILFVSHNMSMIQQICQRAVWLDKGSVRTIGQTNDVVNEYLLTADANQRFSDRHDLGEGVWMEELKITPDGVKSLGELNISFCLNTKSPLSIDSIGFFINNVYEERVGILDLRKERYRIEANGTIDFVVNVKTIPLIEGSYKLGLFIGSNLVSKNYPDLFRFQVWAHETTNGLIPYPVDVRGRVEFNYIFNHD
jgi:lipopolysaccharide transport system ATP-binding protein